MGRSTLLLLAVTLGCTSAATDRQATSGALASAQGGATQTRRLVGEYIGAWDAQSGTFSLVPSTTRNDKLGLTGEALVWGLGAANAVKLVTTGAKYIDTNGTTHTQGTPPTCAVYTASNDCGAGTSACHAATCATVTAQSSSGTLGHVDIEVSALTSQTVVESDDSASLTTGTNSETSAGIDASHLGVWRVTSNLGTTPVTLTTWQFDQATIGSSFVFGVRAWEQVASNVTLAFATTPLAVPATYVGAPTTATSQLDNTGSNSTGSIAAPTVTGSSAFSFSGCTGGTHTIGAGGHCTVTATLTCTSSTSGVQTATAIYTDPNSSASASLTVTGVCSPASETSCNTLHAAYSSLATGEYTIVPNGTIGAIAAYCDMSFDAGDGNGGGGWTMIESTTAGGTLANFTQTTPVLPSTLSYLPLATMQAIAGGAHQINIRVAGSTTQVVTSLYADSATVIGNMTNASHQITDYTTSSGGLPTEDTLWTPTITNMNSSCGTSGGAAWPSVFWACGNSADGLHLLVYSGTLYTTWNWSTGTNVSALEAYLR